MKIALAQINYHIGNFKNNESRVFDTIEKAKTMGADLVVFAELAVSGYPPRDFLEFDDFIAKCHKSIEKIAGWSNGIGVIIGAPSVNPDKKGKDLYNSAWFIADGKVQSVHHKSLLPNYDVFDEYRYFEPGTDFKTIDFKGKKLAITICEDLWNIGDDLLYRGNPMDELFKQQPDIMINIAASPFHYKQADERKNILLQNVAKYQLPLFYVNHVGAQTELLFDGGSLVINAKGEVCSEMAYFKEDLQVFDTDLLTVCNHSKPKPGKMELIHDALVMGIRNYFTKLGLSKAIIGLSGGIDSAVTAVLAERALGKENVYGVMLPSEFSSDHSVSDAVALARNLGIKHDIIPIEEGTKTVNHTLKPQFDGTSFGIAEENIQARMRGLILMALANKFNYILLNTSNKSEAAVGYGTLYGDMNGGLSVLGDVYKTDVFLMARYINKDEEVIPENSIIKPPSAELRPDQKDSDSLPEYDILDKILYSYIEERQGPKEIIAMGFDKKLVDRVLKMVNTNEYKRYQTPPVLRVSSKAFGMGRRMPIVAKYLAEND
ncbi:MAG: NAD+ synthase [Bacteroidales bacterium]|nr:NAD+ synthase [Bacteroidales bacterium]